MKSLSNRSCYANLLEMMKGHRKFIASALLTLIGAAAAVSWILASPPQAIGDTDINSQTVKDLMSHTTKDDAFNGIKLEEFQNFYEWHMVTARYRTDREQQRVTFANDVAWKALINNKPFPEGSVFVKTGFQVGEDPLFPSSKVPGAQLRVMVMKRDFKKYSQTDGWGYALLNRFGTRLANGEIKVQVDKYPSIKQFEISCHACHKIAVARDYVFSRPMFQAALNYKYDDLQSSSLKARFHIPSEEEKKKIQKVLNSEGIKDLVPSEIMFYEMSLFEGSLPELKAPLTNFSRTDKKAFLIYDSESQFFGLSRNLDATAECKNRERYITGCVNKKIPTINLQEVTKIRTLCDGYPEKI